MNSELFGVSITRCAAALLMSGEGRPYVISGVHIKSALNTSHIRPNSPFVYFLNSFNSINKSRERKSGILVFAVPLQIFIYFCHRVFRQHVYFTITSITDRSGEHYCPVKINSKE